VSGVEVSVVVVSHRCRDHLRRCLDSLEAQRAEVDLECRVIDTASGDGTLDAVAGRGWVAAEALDENVGFARAANRGLARARGPAVLVLNPDTALPPGALRALLDELGSRPDVGILGPRLVDGAGRTDRRGKRALPTPWSALCFMTGLDRRLRGPRSTRYTTGWIPEDRAGDVEAVSGSFMLLRAGALREVGAFDERYFMYAEDLDLCLRFGRAGWRVRYWPGVDVLHVGGGSSPGGRGPRAETAFFRTMAPLLREHRPGARGLALSILAAAAAEVVLTAVRVRRRVQHARDGLRRGGG
jgi:GT2 family glycosyltransferase